MRTVDIVVVGAGPAGLSAAAAAAKSGAEVLVLDENSRPGGQLFKQIHKFFGSKEHLAGIRGYDIGLKLLEETSALGAEIRLNTMVYGIYPDKRIAFIEDGKGQEFVQAKKVILATGATENALAFPGSTLPGVMSAGAVQTMVNIHRVLPTEKLLMVGSGNVGLIVSYQVLQAGGKVVALVEAAPKIGGYGVHAAKISRAGVPILVRHTIKRAFGSNCLEGVEICQLDDEWRQIPGSQKEIEVGCIAIAVGLTPLAELAQLCGCEFCYIPRFGGQVPIHNNDMETSVSGIYVAGDISGVEEASSAIEEGRLAGVAAAEALGYVSAVEGRKLKAEVWERLNTLRTGVFGQYRRDLKSSMMEQRRVSVVKRTS